MPYLSNTFSSSSAPSWRVRLHQHPLFRVEPAGLVQDVVGQGNRADVVQRGTALQGADEVGVDQGVERPDPAGFLGENSGVQLHPQQVPLGFGGPLADDRRQGQDQAALRAWARSLSRSLSALARSALTVWRWRCRPSARSSIVLSRSAEWTRALGAATG